ncbi:hypothetical protein VTN49DRAFT_7316 [Thermomyces lanuginosus]|uniref:uncharacterized protein n=1 Tax=Thermomyces lanuginosus TaxID=5541 RepID=UPI0037437795
MLSSPARLLTALCGLASTAFAVHPLKIEGREFIDSKTNERFQIIGVDYQPGGSSGFKGKGDPLSDKAACLRDAAIMQLLGVNTIRVYNLDPSANHDECASIFNAAGIYMILDVNSPLPNGALDRTKPWTTYNKEYMKQVFGVIEAFKNYPNTAAFFAGNEVINEQSVKEVPAYIRAVQRDMKEYIEKHSERYIPVGYSAADVREILMDTANYMACQLDNSTSSHSDFFGLNSYSWCGDATYESSGYNILTDDFRKYPYPVFFSEVGCNLVKPRIFTEVQAIYGENMTEVLSGALIYEYSMEDNEYGLVAINDTDSVTLLVDYENLMSQYAKLDVEEIKSVRANPASVKAPKCSVDLFSSKDFHVSFDIPKRVDGIDDLIEDGHTDGVHVGKLVSVKSQEISQKVYDSKGDKVTGIKFNVLSNDAVNTPSEDKLTTDSSSGSSEDEEDAAVSVRVSSAGLLGAIVATALLAW